MINKKEIEMYEVERAYKELLERVHKVEEEHTAVLDEGPTDASWKIFNHNLECELFDKNDEHTRLVLLCWYRSSLGTHRFDPCSDTAFCKKGAEFHHSDCESNGLIDYAYCENPCVPKFVKQMYEHMFEESRVDLATFIIEGRRLSIEMYVDNSED